MLRIPNLRIPNLRRYASTVAVMLLVASVSSLSSAAARKWVDRKSERTVEAELVDADEQTITLRRGDGKTAKLPLARFSDADQAYVRRWIAERTANKPVPPGRAKGVARSFFTALIDEKLDDTKQLLTAAAASNWASVKDELEAIEVPTSARGLYIRTYRKQDDFLEVDVNLRIGGDFQRTQLRLNVEDGDWRVIAFVPDTEQPENVIDFTSSDGTRVARNGRDDDDDDDYDEDEDEDVDEDDEEEDRSVASRDRNRVRDRADDDSDEDDDEFAFPDTEDLATLTAYIKRLASARPPRVRNRSELLEFQTKIYGGLADAADMVLDHEDAQAADHQLAADAMLLALPGLSQLPDGERYRKRLERLPKDFEDLGLDELVPAAKSVALQVELMTSASPEAARRVVGLIRRHLKNTEPLTPREIQLAQTTARMTERIDDKLAGEVYTEFAELFAKDSKTKPIAEQFAGTARRMNLVGNPIDVTGITTGDEPFDIQQFAGKVVLVDFWATWCGPCMAEMPNIRENYERYRDKGFEVVAVSLDRDLDALKRYMDKATPPWTVLVDEHADNERNLGSYYGISAIPTTVLVGSDGKVITFDCRGRRLGEHLKRLLDDAT